MSVLPISLYGTEVLRQRAKPVAALSDEIVRLVMDMFETMHNASGIGLAATQVGSTQRVIVLDISDMEETKDLAPMVIINPEIVSREGAWVMEEGCLSIPEVRDDVERAENIRLRFKDGQFREIEIDANGLLARVLLHEIDHLDGILFIDHLPKSRRKLHIKALKDIECGEVEVAYPVVSTGNVPA